LSAAPMVTPNLSSCGRFRTQACLNVSAPRAFTAELQLLIISERQQR